MHKVTWARILVVICACLGLGATGTIAAIPAHASTLIGIRQVCTNGPDLANQCANNWNATQANRNPVNFWQVQVSNNNWGVYYEGTVVGSKCGQSGQPACWPFITGSGMNATYNGDAVYGFTWYNTDESTLTGYCMDAGGYNPGNGKGNMYIYQCLGNANQEFVIDWLPYANGFIMVSVGASNRGYSAGFGYWPAYNGCRSGNCGNGNPVAVDASLADAQDWKLAPQAP